MNNTNNLTARESFIRAKKIFFDAWIGKFGGDTSACQNYIDGLKLSQNEIRLEVNLNATSTNFKFGLTPNQQNSSGKQFITENRLEMQDSMVANEYGIYIAQAASDTDTAFDIQTYPNTQRFAAADAAALRGMYSNGNFRITSNNDVIVPTTGLFNHLYIPQTQQTGALAAGSPASMVRGAEDASITLEPNLLLIGSKGYIPEIVLKSALASAAANLRCVLIFRGVLAQNSTSVS